MSAFTKVLVVFILLLSVVFAAVQMALYGLREDYGDKWMQASAKLTKAKGDLEQANKDLTAVRGKYEDVSQKFDKVRDQLNREIAAKDAELARVKELAAKDSETARMSLETITKQEDRIKEVTGQANQYLLTINERNKEIEAKAAEIHKLDDEIKGHKKTIMDHENAILALKEDKQKIADEKRVTADMLEWVVEKYNISLPVYTMKPVTAQVLQVTETNDVIINRGKRHGVLPGYAFVIYRDRDVLGTFVVRAVSERVASGHLRLAEGQTVAQGDWATNEIDVRPYH